MTGDWMVTTGDGSISVELPDGFDAEIEADPGSDGRVRNDLKLVNVTGGTRDQRAAARPARRGREGAPAADRRRHDPAEPLLTSAVGRGRRSGRLCVHGSIAHARGPKRIVPLAALAATAAVPIADRVHARQRQFERHAQLDAESNDVLLVNARERCGDLERRGSSPSDIARAIASKKSGVASGNGLPGSGPSTSRSMPAPRAQHRGLRDEHDVAAFEIDVLVGRVVGRRLCRSRPSASAGYTSRMSTVSVTSAPRTSGEWRRGEQRASIARASASSHASPARTWMAQTQRRASARRPAAPRCRDRRRTGPLGHVESPDRGARARGPWPTYVTVRACISSPSASISATAIACSTTTASASTRTGTTRSSRSTCAPTGSIDRNMVADFSDIKRMVKGWIDRELDHKMILRHDDPLVEPLEALGEPIYKLDSNPTVERIAKLHLRQVTRAGPRRRRRARLGDADVVCGV